jgi:hypothetical protein
MTRALAEQESGGDVMVILQQISSYMLMACGLLYIITVSYLQINKAERLIRSIHQQPSSYQGILCIGHLKEARLKRALNRDQATKDLEVLLVIVVTSTAT